MEALSRLLGNFPDPPHAKTWVEILNEFSSYQAPFYVLSGPHISPVSPPATLSPVTPVTPEPPPWPSGPLVRITGGPLAWGGRIHRGGNGMPWVRVGGGPGGRLWRTGGAAACP